MIRLKNSSVLWHCLLLLVLLTGVLTRTQASNLILADPDTWGYLAPSLSLLADGPFEAWYARSFPYPTLLALWQILGFSLNSFLWVHRLGTFVTGLLIWHMTLLLVINSRLDQTRHLSSLFRGISLFFIFLFVNAPHTQLYEFFFRPESLNFLITVLSIYLIVLQWHLRHVNDQKRTIFFILAFMCSIFSYYFRPNVGLGAFFLGVTSIWIHIGGSLTRNKLVSIGLGLFLSLTFIVIPNFLFTRNDRLRTVFIPQMLIAFHAAPLTHVLRTENPQDVLLKEIIEEESARYKMSGDSGYSLLGGINPDYLVYSTPKWTEFVQSMSPDELKEYSLKLIFRLLSEAPHLYFEKIWKSLSLVYTQTAMAFPEPYLPDNEYLLKETLRSTDPALHRFSRKVKQLDDYRELMRERLEKGPAYCNFVNSSLRGWLKPASKVFFWLHLLCVLIVFATLIARRLAGFRLKADRGFGIWVLILGIYNFLHCFTVSATASLENIRYIEAQMAPFILWIAVTVFWLISIANGLIAERIIARFLWLFSRLKTQES